MIPPPVPQLKDVLPGVMHHHERYDGAVAIPTVCRERTSRSWPANSSAVVDMFDAMSSDRSYRKKLTRDHVLGEIARRGGSQLDLRLAMLMVRLDLGLYSTR